MVPVFPIHPAPSIRGVEVAPKCPEGCVGVRASKVFTLTKEVKVYGESMPMQGIFMSVRDTRITVAIPHSDFVTVLVGECKQLYQHPGE